MPTDPQPLQPVAWRDSGQTINGMRGGAGTKTYRVITDETKQAMPQSVAEAYSQPLYTAPPPVAAGVPEGFVVVPVEPTKAMLRAHSENTDGLDDFIAANDWQRMLAAAPSAPAADQEVEQADTARLDFMEREWFFTGSSGLLSFCFSETWDAGKHPSLRAAVDAAIAAEKGGA